MNEHIILRSGGKTLKIENKKLCFTASVFRAVNHPLRQRMLALLDEQKKISLIEVQRRLKLVQSVASHHLVILSKAGVVKTTREGKYNFYLINRQRMAQVAKITEELS